MVGKILGGRYELLEKIGAGGMAVVYRAKCLLLNRTVAVKMLRDDLDSNEEFLRRFNIEAQSAASLTNQHIVSIYDVGKDDNINYIVMEYVEGETLKEFIKDNSPINWQQSVRISMGIADALSEAHKKHIIHRDIKPQNIIVTADGNIKVTDFGIARVSSGATISVDGDVLGSVHYLSPEQARGGYVDERSDIYSLGVVMYEMLTGKVPFDGDTPVAVAMKQIEQPPVNPCDIIDGIPENVSAIVLKAMSKETASRYATVSEMYEDLAKVLTDPDSLIVDSKTTDEYLDEATKKIPPVKFDNAVLDLTNGRLIREEELSKSNNSERIAKSPDYNKTKKEKVGMTKSDKKAVIAAVATSLVIVILLFTGFAEMLMPGSTFWGGIFGIFNNEEVTVPEVVSMSVEEAEKFVEGTVFQINVIGSEESSEYDAGAIMWQSPKAGLTRKGFTTIDVKIAEGANGEGITISDYKNDDYRTVESKLKNLGFKVKIIRQNSDDIAVDYIISQSPAEGTNLTKGSTVTLYVSDGVGDNEIVVPNLIGKSYSEAKRLIEEANLTVGNNEYKDSSEPKDTVIDQSVKAGNSAAAKEVISLVLSNGSKNSDNNHSNKNNSDTKEIVLTYYLPTDKDEVTVKLVANGEVIYEGIEYPKKKDVFEYQVTDSGNVKYEFYVDGKKHGD